MTTLIAGRDVRDDRPLLGAQRYSAWWSRMPAERDHTYESRGETRRRFALADPTDIDAIGFSPSTKQALIVEFKADVSMFLKNVGQSNAVTRTAQLPGVRARVIGEPSGQPAEHYDPDTSLPFARVGGLAQVGSITVSQLAQQFVDLRAEDILSPAPLPHDGGRGLENISSWWPAGADAAAAPHHIAATFQVGFGRAPSSHLFIEFVSDLDRLAGISLDKFAMLAHLATLPRCTVIIASDPHAGEVVEKGSRYERSAPMPFISVGSGKRTEATVDEFVTAAHNWLLRADSAR